MVVSYCSDRSELDDASESSSESPAPALARIVST